MAEIDREKTIEGLKRYLNYPKPLCDVAQQAITLLKEQEHERLKVNIRHRNNDGYCPSCGKCIVMDFCPNNCGFCGQAVKWE